MNKTIQHAGTISRYFICLLMLIYGLVKVFQGQFYTDFYWKDTPLAKLSGMELMWSFYSYSPTYETIIGLIEVTIGLLVFYKKTTKLGVVLLLPIMANLILMNIVFNIGALGIAIPIFIAGMILLFINFTSYKACFIESGDLRLNKSSKYSSQIPKAAILMIGCSLAALIIYNNKFKIKQDNEIKGAWALVDNPTIKKVYFEKGKTIVFRDNKDRLYFGSYQTMNNKTITINDVDNNVVNWKDLSYQIYKDTLLISTIDKKQLLVKAD